MSHSEALIMFVLLLPTQYTPTPTVSLTSAEYRKHNTERENMLLHLLLWFTVNGLPAQLDCDADNLNKKLQTCTSSCNLAQITSCIQQCLTANEATQKQCDDQKGKPKLP